MLRPALLAATVTLAACSTGPATRPGLSERAALPPASERAAPAPRAAAAASESVQQDSVRTGRRVATRVLTPARYQIRVADLPAPYASESARKGPRVIPPPADAVLNVPAGFVVNVFADGLAAPRQLALTPEGDVLVAESRANRIRRLADRDGDGVADVNTVFADTSHELDQPFGMGFAGGAFFVANTGEVLRFPYAAGAVSGRGARIAELTPGGYNQHWTRGLVVSPDARQLYVSIGSRTNVDEEELPRAAVLRMNLDGSGRSVFASGLRNPVGLAFHPTTGVLYTNVNERDGLGDDLVPDYFTAVEEGAFYGWPYAYLTPGNLDPRRLADGRSERPDLAARTRTPDVLYQAHSAALGLAFVPGGPFPARYRSGAFTAMRGSWNRSEGTGYKLVFVPFENGRPSGGYEDFLTGFLTDPTGPSTFARPVGLLTLPDGSLLMTDDGNGRIYRISYQG